MDIKLKIKNAIFILGTPYRKLLTKILAKRYPWLIPYNGWNDEPENEYSYLMWEPGYGWGRIFFYSMMEDIRKTAIKNKTINSIHTIEQKEKWGQLVFDVNGVDKDINEIIDAYTTLSANICIHCGKPDVGHYKCGWILPVCPKCFDRPKEFIKTYDDLMSQDRRMADWYEYKRWDKDKEEWIHYKIDIRPFANKIRRRWNFFHPFRKTSYS